MTCQRPASHTATPQPTMIMPSSRASRATSVMITCGKRRRRSQTPLTPPHLPASSFTRPEGKPPQPGIEKPPGSFLTGFSSRVRNLGCTKQREGPCSVKAGSHVLAAQTSPLNLRMGQSIKASASADPESSVYAKEHALRLPQLREPWLGNSFVPLIMKGRTKS